MSLEDVYREAIMDHYARPRNKGVCKDPVIVHHMHNPTCGDDIEVQLELDGDRIEDVKFQGRGCSISQSSASMMTVALKGKTLAEAKETIQKFLGMMKGEAGDHRELGELQALQGVAKLPVRIKCATLSWHAIETGITQYRAQAEQKGADAR